MSTQDAAQSLFDDIFGGDSDDDDNVVTNVRSSSKEVKSSAGGKRKDDDEDEDIFASDDDSDSGGKVSSSSLSRLKKSGSSSKPSKKERKDKKEEKKSKKEKKRKKSDGDSKPDETQRSRALKRSKQDSQGRKSDDNERPAGSLLDDSGDEYGSEGEVERTAEDDAFIDGDDDDDDIVKDYNEQKQSFKDDKPDGWDERRYEDHEYDRKEKGSTWKTAMAAIKKPKIKEMSDVEREGLAVKVLDIIVRASNEDDRLFSADQPAIEKLRVLPQVEKMLFVRSIQNTLLDHNVLDALNKWIEPRDSKTLSSLTVRSSVYKMLLSLPCQIDHLRRSGIGKTIIALRKNKLETIENKKMLKEIIEKWTRPIFTSNDAHRANDNIQIIKEALEIKKKQDAAAGALKASDLKFDVTDNVRGKELGARVRLPFSSGFMFTVQPESKVDKATAREANIGGTKKELNKKMKITQGKKSGAQFMGMGSGRDKA